MISGVFRGTVWNQTIPDAMRGRLAGIEMLSYSSARSAARSAPAWSPTCGRCAARSPAAASRASSGSRLTALWLRDFWSYDARTDEHAVRERSLRQPLDPA